MSNDKSGLGKFVEWLVTKKKEHNDLCHLDEAMMLEEIIKEAKSLLAQEQAQKPLADGALVEELRRIIKEICEEIKSVERSQTDYCDGTTNEVVCYIFKMMLDELKAVVSRHMPQESLAVKEPHIICLAMAKHYRLRPAMTAKAWIISLVKIGNRADKFVAHGETYWEAEKLAREFLNGLGEGK